MRNSLLTYLLGGLLALLTACTSDSQSVEEKPLDLRSPMMFGSTFSAADVEVTRASDLQTIHDNFKVGAWKAYGQTDLQQTVMNGFKVAGKDTTFANETTGYVWFYKDVNGQPLCYWDMSAFPYEFHGVAPFLEGADITPTGITVSTSDKPFQAQQLDGTTYNVSAAAAEPCLVAQVSRVEGGTEYRDFDRIKNIEINLSSKSNPNRDVHLPFHHLMSKVGFRIFIDDPMPRQGIDSVFIKSITISAVKAESNFIVKSNTYTATLTSGFNRGTFSPDSTIGEFNLLKHGRYDSVNFYSCLNKDTSYDLTPGFLLQIPQGNLKIRVQLEIETRGEDPNDTKDPFNKDFDFDTLLRFDPSDEDPEIFTWEPEKRYVFYLRVPNLYKHEIVLHTCEILPWDEVQTTEIGVEM